MRSKREFFLEPRNTAMNDAIRKDKASYHTFKEKKLLLEVPVNTILAEDRSGKFLFPLEDQEMSGANMLASTMTKFKALANAENEHKEIVLMTQAQVAVASSNLWELQRRRNEVKAKLRDYELQLSTNPNIREHALREMKTDFPIIPWGPRRLTAKERISSIPFIPVKPLKATKK